VQLSAKNNKAAPITSANDLLLKIYGLAQLKTISKKTKKRIIY